MHRRTFFLLCAPYQRTGPLSPHQVLGVTPGTPFEEVRHRFHELTRRYHPDMQDGDPVKFREINNAYRVLRAEYRSKTAGATAGGAAGEDGGASASSRFRSGAGPSSRATPTGGAFWEERNERIRKESDRREQERWARQENDRYRANRKRTLLSEFLFIFSGSEIAISLATVVVVLLYSVERYHTVNRMLEEKRLHLKNMDEGLPPPMPMELDKELQKKYSQPPESTELQIDALRIREESKYRRATQRKFEDFREFMFVYDPEAIASRRVTSTRFSHQYAIEGDIPKRCPIVRQFNSEQRTQNYSTIEKELEKVIHDTPWVSPDAGYAGALIAKGLGSIAANSPNTTKWTFIEYTDLDQGNKAASTTCLAAIRNLRFEQTGMCQRVTVTGRSELHPELVEQRQQDLKEGKLKKRSLVRGGVLPLRDLSVPLEMMKL
jgi:curved DNA-binding protein CbpA